MSKVCEFVGGPLDGKKRAVQTYQGRLFARHYVNTIPPVSVLSFNPNVAVQYEQHCYILREDGKYEHVT